MKKISRLLLTILSFSTPMYEVANCQVDIHFYDYDGAVPGGIESEGNISNSFLKVEVATKLIQNELSKKGYRITKQNRADESNGALVDLSITFGFGTIDYEGGQPLVGKSICFLNASTSNGEIIEIEATGRHLFNSDKRCFKELLKKMSTKIERCKNLE